jgi:hypothetical protein
MENYDNGQGSEVNSQRDFGSRLLIVKSFIKRLIDQFKVTEQDLKDAGVYLRRMYD